VSQFHQGHYKQKDGLAMGASTSAILSEIFLQHLEHKKIIPFQQKHDIMA
jgi:hypothetical protein